MQAIARLSVVRKIYGLLGLMILLTVTVSADLIWTFKYTGARYSSLIDHEVREVVGELRLRGALQNFARQMSNVLLLQTPPAGLDELERSVGAISNALGPMVNGIDQHDGGRAVVLLDAIRAALPRLDATAAAIFAVKRDAGPGHDESARALWRGPDGHPLVLKLYTDLATFADAEMKRLDEMSDEYAGVTSRTATYSAIAIALGVAGAGILAFLIATRGIARPLAGLGDAMRRLAEQDLDAEVPGTARGDEIGAMARAVQVFKANALHARALEAERARERGTAEEARTTFEAQRTRSADEAARAVGAIGTGLERLAAGDLTFELEEGLATEYERLRGDFNKAVGLLHGSMGTVVAGTGAIRAGAREIAQAADDLSRRTEQQAASLAETASALDGITGTVKRTAQSSDHARTIVATARTDAERSGLVVQDAVVAMSAIERSSEEIGHIIGVIDEIAFQTNLLALNAGVEAARAGDAGRGFAVVASEVRALAQRSAEAAKEIKALILASSQQVSRGVQLVGETGESLGRIVDHVGRISGVITEIAASAQEQATGLHQVTAAVNQMDHVTQQNAAMVEESTAASHALSREAEALAGLTGHFIVDELVRQPSVKLAPRVPKAAARLAGRPVARPGRVAPAGASPSREPVARRRAAAGAGDGWAEF